MSKSDSIKSMAVAAETIFSDKNLDYRVTSGRMDSWFEWDVTAGDKFSCQVSIRENRAGVYCQITPVCSSESGDLYFCSLRTSGPICSVAAWLDSNISDGLAIAEDFDRLCLDVLEIIRKIGIRGPIRRMPPLDHGENGFSVPFVIEHPKKDGILTHTVLQIGIDRNTFFSTIRSRTLSTDRNIDHTFFSRSKKRTDSGRLITFVYECLDEIQTMISDGRNHPVSTKEKESIFDQLVRMPGCFGSNVVAFKR